MLIHQKIPGFQALKGVLPKSISPIEVCLCFYMFLNIVQYLKDGYIVFRSWLKENLNRKVAHIRVSLHS